MLVVDDSALVRRLLGQIFAQDAGFKVEFARTGLEALDKLSVFDPDVITLDVNMPDMDGLACLDRIMLENPRPVVMVSSAAGADTTFEAMRLGAVDVIAKPSGAMSLDIHEMAPRLVETVRSASSAKVRGSRLRERVARKAGLGRDPAVRPGASVGAGSRKLMTPSTGEGLVVVGVSTGGPPALERLLEPLPKDFGWPIVIAQHMPATFTGALARRLNGLFTLNVSEVARLTPLQPGQVYIARGDADIVISMRSNRLVAMPAPAKPDYLWRPSVERLVRTAMEALPAQQIVGVMLTGMGSDGSQAMADLRSAGGRTIAESEESAVVWGMPGELVRAGGADWIEAGADIGPLLKRLIPCP